MAEETQSILPSGLSLQLSPDQINNSMNFVFWLIVGVVAVGIIGFFLYRWIRKMQYNINVTINKEAGNAVVAQEDWAKKIYTPEGKYVFHYLILNKRSPIIEDKHFKIVKKTKFFGLMPYSVLGFDAYFKDGKIIPMHLNKKFNAETGEIEDVALTGIDYDAFNFIISEVDAYQSRKQKVDKLLALAPYALMVLVVISWVVGTILSNKHNETMAHLWLNSVKDASTSLIDKIGTLQVIPQK